MKEKQELTFSEKFAKYKEEGGKAPIIYKTLAVKVNTQAKEVILSIEEIDREGETVIMDGMRLPDWIKENGIPMIDSHKSMESVTVNGLGALRNPRIEVRNGKKALVTDPDFAPTPNGEIAKILYMGVDGGKPYFTNVSMGFVVYDYDNLTGEIKEWEPIEGSLVTVGANASARFRDKAIDSDLEVAKNLARFKQIKTPFKEFTKLFLDEKFCEKIGYEKDGDLLVDINGIYDKIEQLFTTEKEAPTTVQEAPAKQPQPTVTVSSEAIRDQIGIFFNKLESKFND